MVIAKRYPIEINTEKKETIWKEFSLSEKEIKNIEQENIDKNIRLLSRSLDIAKGICKHKEIQKEENIVSLAVAIFNKNAQHVHFLEESMLQVKRGKEINKEKKPSKKQLQNKSFKEVNVKAKTKKDLK